MEIRDYVSEAVSFLTDAYITNKEEVVRRGLKGLDAELQPFVTI